MVVDEIMIGASIELVVRYNGQNITFHDKVVEIIKDNSILVNSIKVNNKTIGFSDKCRINFLYKIDNRLYIWENTNVKLVKYQGRIYHKIDLNGIGKPHNRREAFRMYIGEDMQAYLNSSSGQLTIDILLKDISETGMGFISKEEIELNRIVRLKLKDYKIIINLSAVVVRKEYIPHLKSFIYGCKFNEKNTALGKYISRKQNEQLNKKSSNLSSPPTKKKIADITT